MSVKIPVAKRLGLMAHKGMYADVFIYTVEGNSGLFRRVKRGPARLGITTPPCKDAVVAVWDGNGALLSFKRDETLTSRVSHALAAGQEV